MPELNIHAIALELHDTGEYIGPDALAEALFARIEPDDYADVLRVILRGYAQKVIGERRQIPEMPLHEASVTPAGRPSARSWKRAGIQTWAKALRSQVHVGPNSSDWKVLADCTRDELLFAASERRKKAEENLAVAVRYEYIVSAMDRRGVKTPGELSEGDLREALGDAA